MKVIVQRDEIILSDLRVRGVRVLHVDRAVRERRVSKRVIDAANVAKRELITRGQRGPPILAVEKLVCETDFQIRMFAQIADRMNA